MQISTASFYNRSAAQMSRLNADLNRYTSELATKSSESGRPCSNSLTTPAKPVWAEEAKATCPVSKALADTEISLTASLA